MDDYILINSKDRVSGLNASDFKVQLNTPVNNLKCLKLQQAIIPYSWYTLRNTNLYFEEQGGGGMVTVAIPEQHYSFTQFATEIASLLNTNSVNGLTYTVTYDSQTGKYTINSSANSRFFFASYPNNKLYEYLGFNTNNGPDADTSYGLQHISSGIAAIYTPYLLLSIDPLSSNIISTGSISKALIIPVTGNFLDTILYLNESIDCQIGRYGFGRNLNLIGVRLLDPDGSPLPLNGGEIVLKFSYSTY